MDKKRSLSMRSLTVDKICCIFLVLFLSTVEISAQFISVDPANIFYLIAPLHNFKKAAVSLTFDDAYPNQFEIGIPLLKQRGLTATFYVITSRLNDIISITSKDILKDFEIGSHTVSHPDLTQINSDEMVRELTLSKEEIQNYFGTDNGLTLSYPWGSYNKKVILAASKNYLAARSTNPGYNSFFKINRYALNMQKLDKRTRIQDANKRVEFAISNNLWLIEMIHNIDKDGIWSISPDSLAVHLDFIKNSLNDIWCTSVVNLIKYRDELQSAGLTCDMCNDTVYKVRLNDFLDDTLYKQELTLRIKIPDNWENVTVSGEPEAVTRIINNNKFVEFNSVPDNHLITIMPESISRALREQGIRLVYISPSPVMDNLEISIDRKDPGEVEVYLFDIRGRIFIKQLMKNNAGINNILIDASRLGQGLYFLSITDGGTGQNIFRRVIKL